MHEYYQKRLIGRIYTNWKQALTRQLLIKQHEHRLAQLQERVLMRWAFEQWKSCENFFEFKMFLFYLLNGLDMNDLADEQRTMHMAEQYSDRRIMVK